MILNQAKAALEFRTFCIPEKTAGLTMALTLCSRCQHYRNTSTLARLPPALQNCLGKILAKIDDEFCRDSDGALFSKVLR